MSLFERCQYQDKETWLNLRGKGLGGSDVASVVGLNPYKSNLDLWKEKTNKTKSDFEDNKFTLFGKGVESAITQIIKHTFVDELEVITADEVLVRIDKPYLRASLDGELLAKTDFEFMSYWKPFYNKQDEIPPEKILIKKGMKGVLEDKTTFVLNSMHKEKWHNTIPDNYYCQVLHYLNVTGYDFVILPAMLNWEDVNGVKTHEIRYYGFLRESVVNDLEYLEQKCDKFWLENVVKDIEPPLIINI